MKIFLALVKQIAELLSIPDSIVDGFLADIEGITGGQSSSTLRQLAADLATKGLSEAAAKPLIDAFDTNYEHLQEDRAFFQRIQLPAGAFTSAYSVDPANRIEIDQLIGSKENEEFSQIKNVPFDLHTEVQKAKVAKAGGSFRTYVALWVALFGFRTNITIDVFAQGIQVLSQIKGGSQDNFLQLLESLKAFGETNNYTIDLLADIEHIEKFIEVARNEANKKKADEVVVTDKGKEAKIQIQVDAFKIKTLREQVNSLKASAGPPVKLALTRSPTDEEEEEPGLQLQDAVISLPSGRAYWTLGAGLDSDAFVPKASAAWGHQFALRLSGGKFYVKDQSALGLKFQTYIRPVKGQEYPLKQGDVVSLANAIVYAVNGLGGGNANFELLEEIQPSGAAYVPVPQKEFPVAGGAVIGKLAKHAIQLKHELISGTHCTITENSLKDSSSNGTFIAVRSADSISKAQQSGWVEFNKAASIAFYSYEVTVQE